MENRFHLEKHGMASYGLGIVSTIIALLGLFMASGAQDVTMEWTGYLLTLFGAAFTYGLIIRNTGH